MPIRQYVCRSEHATDRLFNGTYPPEILCPKCGAVAEYTLGAPSGGVVVGSATPCASRKERTLDGFRVVAEGDTFVVRQKGDAPVVVDWVCANGHRHFETFDEVDVPEVTPDCKHPVDDVVCGLPTKRVIGVPDADWFTKEFPHGRFDPGLGCWIRDRAHWRQVMKEQGVVEMDWGPAMDAQLRADNERDRYNESVVREMIQSFEVGPDAASMKTMRDQGVIDDWSIHARALGVEIT